MKTNILIEIKKRKVFEILEHYSYSHDMAPFIFRKVEEVQADLSTSTQKWHNLNNQHEQLKREKEREIETLNAKHDNTIATVNNKLDDLVSLDRNFKC